ncbi:isopentenyl-diphosphate Delta-isomerase [Quadrisphaera sp. DSM 44207]|uniref:isopentenyl-diphosphate Delta-isomerase n=1 Tax=Quadrisphaera sp. DSM 44207 TaxID=1881057 RepID=UPI000892659A|nr:isopentenyl-diphosphate Delta-isomerase [Quadrisphaera sp. DSM 44207]SDQ72272.1 isopentenyl-diphosphate delta-isomerase [Quadrisphaera sp. DSM 44207]
MSAPATEQHVERPVERVVLLGADGSPVGTADKATVHGADTPLHLAFSCYATDGAGRLLLTRRAMAKRTWPGVWTNTVCGHPAPGEGSEEAVVRRARQELGLRLRDVVPVLPDFAYRATDASGVVENEVCPVYTAVADADPDPDPDEVAEWRWVDWRDAVDVARRAPWALSPWSVLQLPLLDAAR